MVDREFYEALRSWNRKKSFRNFAGIYRAGFLPTRAWPWQGPLWRVCRIIRNTVSGRYKEMEKELTRLILSTREW